MTIRRGSCMQREPGLMEKEAHEFLAREKIGEAYDSFKKAGCLYKEKGAHKEAALCLASAASCWAVKSGERMFHNSSLAYEEAAKEAELAGDLEYASLLYRQAAINFERDMEFFSFSDSFYRSRECLRKFLTKSLVTPQKIHDISAAGIERGAYGIMKRLFLCLSLTFSALIWGHGERPNRAFSSGIVLIFLSALFYMHGNLTNGAVIFKPNFFQALYFSVITFTTVGYGDFTPVGITKLVAMTEVLSGIFIVPVFIVGLSRKFLRT